MATITAKYDIQIPVINYYKSTNPDTKLPKTKQN